MCTDCCPRSTSSKGIASSLVASQAQGEPRAWQRMKQVAKDRQQPAVCRVEGGQLRTGRLMLRKTRSLAEPLAAAALLWMKMRPAVVAQVRLGLRPSKRPMVTWPGCNCCRSCSVNELRMAEGVSGLTPACGRA